MPENTLHFRWVRPPSHLAREVDRYGQKILVAVYGVAAYVGQQMQDAARANKPWEDRSGAAKTGLFFAVSGFGLKTIVGEVDFTKIPAEATKGNRNVQISGDKDRLVIVLGHTVYYGKYLELAHGGRFAVVMSTIEAHLGALERMLGGLLA